MSFPFIRNPYGYLGIVAIAALMCTSSCSNKRSPETTPMADDSVIVQGAEVFNDHCAGCHGRELQGSIAPALRNTTFKHGSSLDSIVNTIQRGVPGTEMIGWSESLSDDDINSVATYITIVQTKPELIARGEKDLSLTTQLYKLRIEPLVTEGIEKPWGIAFIDNTHALVTENKGNIRWFVDNKLDAEKISGIPFSYASDAWGGFMDVAVDPDYANNRWVYLSFSSNKANSPDKLATGMTKVVRGKITDHRWHDEQTLFQVHDSLAVTGGTRWGCRFLIDKDGYLYFSIGDMSRANDSQILTRPEGKVFRINRDGTIPKDNPFYGHKRYLQAIYSWGNRNAQGFAQHPGTNVIYETEHGPQGGDELNILKKNSNYGWPVITYGIDYDGSKVSDETHHDGMEQPITYWTPSIAVSAIDFVDGQMFPAWKNNLLVGALKFEELRRLVIDGDKVKEQEILLKGYGRVRDVTMAPDGSLFLLTNTPDAILRIVPQ
ncbi:MAG: PQQ-dependent sugar dehydrogenase [Chryseolinea sp.]